MERPDRTSPRIRGTTRDVERAAITFRRALTPAEQELWAALRNRQLDGLRFRCQHPVGHYILDFYCPARKLVVELDGSVHDSPEQAFRDAARSHVLAAYGCRVLRFRNEEVLDHLPEVLEAIRRAAAALPDTRALEAATPLDDPSAPHDP